MEKDIFLANVIEQRTNSAKNTRDYKRWRALYLYSDSASSFTLGYQGKLSLCANKIAI